MLLVASLLLTMFVCVSPTTVYAQSGETDSSESLGESIGIIGGTETDEVLDGPLGKILAGLLFVFAAIINAIGAVIGTVITLILGIGAFLWGIVEFFVGLFQ